MLDNLTKDVLEAEKAGMSYGQWKALHPHTKYSGKKRSRLKMEEAKTYRKCVICGATFEVKYPHHVMCSDECREERDRQHNRAWQEKHRAQMKMEG